MAGTTEPRPTRRASCAAELDAVWSCAPAAVEGVAPTWGCERPKKDAEGKAVGSDEAVEAGAPRLERGSGTILKWKPCVRPAGLSPAGWVGRRGCCRLMESRQLRSGAELENEISRWSRRAGGGPRCAEIGGPLSSRQGLLRVEFGARRTLRDSKTASSLGRGARGTRKRRVARDVGPRQMAQGLRKVVN